MRRRRSLPDLLLLTALTALLAALLLAADVAAADHDEDKDYAAQTAGSGAIAPDDWVAHFGLGDLYWTPPSREAAAGAPGPGRERPIGKRRKDESGRRRPTKHDVSPPLRSMLGKGKPSRSNGKEPENPSVSRSSPLSPTPDTAIQEAPSVAAPPTSTSFNGSVNVDGYFPPDTNGDVGGNYIVEWVNATIDIYDRSGTEVLGPLQGTTPWDGFGGACEDNNSGDPIVKYDRIAKRWLLTQFAFGSDPFGNPVGPFYQCVAISTSDDPTGSYYRYAYLISNTVLNDYPKVGIWSDGYWFSFNNFDSEDPNFSFVGTTVAVADRAAMLSGDPDAALITHDLGANTWSLLPADIEGTTPPPGGAAETFAEVFDSTWGITGTDALQLFTATPNWGAGTITWSAPTNLTTAAFTLADQVSVPQPGGGSPLDTLGNRLMYRLAYRNLGTSEVMAVTHSVVASGVVSPRWYELQRTTGGWSILQQSTFKPDSTHRWMGSMAVDHDGNLALGYSKSSTSVSPTAVYTGRLATDPLGTMRSEVVFGAGNRSQTAGERWGDYSSVIVDPDDDCTFWAIEEYYSAPLPNDDPFLVSVGVNWHTRIGSFRFPGCIAFGPYSGWMGDAVVIQGSRYESATAVRFGGVNASFSVDSSAHTVTATVPLGAALGPLTIVTPGGTFTSAKTFTPGLQLDSLSATSGLPGDLVTITGRGFGAATSVKFGTGAATTYTVDSDTQITATVPATATTGKVTVVKPNGLTVQSVDTFTLIQAVTGFTPTSGPTGTLVTVTGSTLQGATSVKFGGVASTSVTNITPTSLKATVPPNAVYGQVAVTTPNGTATSAGSFTVVPKFTSLTPASASGGATVAFNGSGLSGAVGVTFNGTVASSTIVSGTRINAVVPVDATMGMITVTLDSGQTVDSTVFKPLPKITGLSLAAAAGTTATVTGTNFLGATSVKVGLLSIVGYSIDSATQISFTIPDAAVTGKVSVTTPAGTGVSVPNLSVLPTISFTSPTHAAAGTPVMFTGKTFSGTTSVKFNGVAASSFTVLSPTSLRATVPTAATSGPVSVTNAGGPASGPTFTVDPRITGFTPAAAPGGALVTINGTGLGSPIDVSFNGFTAAIVSATATSVKATVPAAATLGVISITTAAGTTTTIASFKPLPKITGFSQPSGPIGTVVTLTGTNFTDATTLKIGAIAIGTFTVDGATQITATIPNNAITGIVSATTPAGTGGSAVSFGVVATIDLIAPSEAQAGVTVTFTGKTFVGVSSVKFNGVAATSVSVVSATSLRATVPAGATSGPVSVTNAGGPATGPTFTVDPKITGLAPSSAVAGATVTISGSGLASATDVSFNGVAASIVLNTATQVKALVPSTATTGTISVTTPSGTTASTAIFKPLPKITGFSPLSGPRGTPGVVLTGTNLSGATAVKIGTIAVTSFTVDSALQITLTIPATAVTARFTVTTPAGTGTSATAFTVTASTLKARRSSRHR